MAKKLNPDVITWSLKINGSDAQKEMRKLADESKELKKQQDTLRKAMAQLTAQGKKDTEEYKRLDAALKENRKEMDLNRQKMDALTQRMNLNEMSAAQLEKRMKSLKKALKETSKATEPERYKSLEQELKRTEQAMSKASGSTSIFGKALKSIGGMRAAVVGAIAGLAASIGVALVGAVKSAISKIIEFEKANSTLAAVLGTTKDEIADLTSEARRLGATTAYTASQVTSLQIELAKLGFGKESIKEMTPSVLKFATAVGTDLASAASLAGSTLRIFGLEANQIERVLSTMAVGCTKSALSFSYLDSAMSTVGPVANAFGFSIEETTSLLGALANAGFDASSAATATRNILLNLADANGKLAQALGGPVKDIYELVDGLNKLNDEGIDLAKTLELTDKRSVAAFNTFLKGSKTILELNKGVSGAEDAFNDMANEMANNVQGSLNALSSAWENLLLNFYNSRGAMKSIVDWLTKVVQWMGNLFGISEKVKATIAAETAVQERMTEATKGSIEPLKELIKKVNEGKESIDKLKEATGLANLERDREGRLTKESTKAINEHIGALQREAKILAYKEELQALYNKRLQQEKEVDEARVKLQNTPRYKVMPGGSAAGAMASTTGYDTAAYNLKAAQEAAEGTTAAIAKLEAELKEVEGDITQTGKSGKDAAGGTTEQIDIELMTLEQLKKTLKEIKKLRDAEHDSAKIVKYNAQITEIQERIKLLSGQATTAEKDAAREAKEAAREAKESDRDLNTELKKTYDERISIVENAANEQAEIIRRSSVSQQTQQIQMQAIETTVAQERVRVANENMQRIEEAEWKTEEARVKAVKEASEQILVESRNLATQRLKLTAQLSRMVEQGSGLEGLKTQYERQIAEVQAAYDAILAMAEKNKLDTTNLKAQENSELEQLNYDYLQKLYQIQQQIGVTWQDQFQNELLQLQHLKNQELITEEQYQKKKKQMQVEYAAQYAQYYTQLMSGLVTELANYEISQSDAKYDVLIKQAENEGKETEQLETEKANAKLRIQKKYALTEFLVKTSQIIADTAVAIMMAYAQLGPIAGNVAAAMIGVTGAMQAASAWTEYQKIKNLPESVAAASSSTSGSATATRTLTTGYSQGGPTGQGGTYEVAGVVHKNEYVIPSFLMGDDYVLDSIGNIEALRQQKLHGYASGGSTSDSPVSASQPSGYSSLIKACQELKQAVQAVERIRAYVVYTDLEKKQQTLNNARNYFTR